MVRWNELQASGLDLQILQPIYTSVSKGKCGSPKASTAATSIQTHFFQSSLANLAAFQKPLRLETLIDDASGAAAHRHCPRCWSLAPASIL